MVIIIINIKIIIVIFAIMECMQLNNYNYLFLFS